MDAPYFDVAPVLDYMNRLNQEREGNDNDDKDGPPCGCAIIILLIAFGIMAFLFYEAFK